ncbi:MAG: TIGR01777 family oxidoreductase [Planctomycetaceae bacterium]
MKVTVIGGSGFIGKRLVAGLRERGDAVTVTGRSSQRLAELFGEGVRCLEWDPAQGPPPAAALEGCDGVVNLAGESVASGRWTKGRKERIRASRVDGTRNLVAALAAAGNRPKVLVNASAIGYYGDAGHRALHESSANASDFLGGVCAAWEGEAAKARATGVRTAIVRFGVVLGRDGGAYPLMSRPFRLFVGGPIGLGRRWISWIHRDDVVGLILHLLDTPTADGVFNGTAPQPVANAEFTKELAAALKRPALLPVPPLALKLLLGGFAAVVLSSQRVLPMRTLASGYAFRYPTLRGALEDLR